MRRVLEIRDLVLRFYTHEGVVKALEEVNLDIASGEIFGLVGETGCGKTVTALSILGLTPSPGKIEQGRILFHGERSMDLLTQSQDTLRGIRGREIAMIFQDPSAALNPVYTVGQQIAEVVLLHRCDELCLRGLQTIDRKIAQSKGWVAPLSKIKHFVQRWAYLQLLKPHTPLGKFIPKMPFAGGMLKGEAKTITIQLLKEMQIPDAERVVDRYPHELSGGMKQRVVIAMAMAGHPRLLIADEPTTSLDVTIQAQILSLLRRLRAQWGSSILYITHNLGVVAEICDRVGVMYAGSVCEVAEVKELFHHPLHPYTKALLQTIPRPLSALKTIPGTVPQLIEPPPGCRFHPRCSQAMEKCSKDLPLLQEVSQGHWVACYLY
jgi:peptide/nickel transport system ATP-binding protein